MADQKGVRVRGNRVQINWKRGGQRRFETTTFPPTEAGKRAASRLRDERIAAAEHGETQAPTFMAYAQDWLDNAALAHSTRQDYRNRLNQFWIGPLGPMRLDKIKTGTIRDVLNSVDWKSPKSRINAVIPVRSILRQAWEDEWIQHNPADRISLKLGQSKEPDPYSREERDALLRNLEGDTMAWCFFAVAFDTGMRTGELLALRWEDWDGEALSVHSSMVRGRRQARTKTYKARRVLVGALTKQALERVGTMFAKREVFLNQYGRPYQSAHHLLKRFRKAHKGIRARDTRNYPWRHTYASMRLTDGAPVSWIAKQLGNSPAVCERTYARWLPSDDDSQWLDTLSGTSGVQGGAE